MDSGANNNTSNSQGIDTGRTGWFYRPETSSSPVVDPGFRTDFGNNLSMASSSAAPRTFNFPSTVAAFPTYSAAPPSPFGFFPTSAAQGSMASTPATSSTSSFTGIANASSNCPVRTAAAPDVATFSLNNPSFGFGPAFPSVGNASSSATRTAAASASPFFSFPSSAPMSTAGTSSTTAPASSSGPLFLTPKHEAPFSSNNFKFPPVLTTSTVTTTPPPLTSPPPLRNPFSSSQFQNLSATQLNLNPFAASPISPYFSFSAASASSSAPTNELLSGLFIAPMTAPTSSLPLSGLFIAPIAVPRSNFQPTPAPSATQQHSIRVPSSAPAKQLFSPTQVMDEASGFKGMLQSISAMEQHADKSHEEFRWAIYQSEDWKNSFTPVNAAFGTSIPFSGQGIFTGKAVTIGTQGLNISFQQ